MRLNLLRPLVITKLHRDGPSSFPVMPLSNAVLVIATSFLASLLSTVLPGNLTHIDLTPLFPYIPVTVKTVFLVLLASISPGPIFLGILPSLQAPPVQQVLNGTHRIVSQLAPSHTPEQRVVSSSCLRLASSGYLQIFFPPPIFRSNQSSILIN